jgi:hypothetical protein
VWAGGWDMSLLVPAFLFFDDELREKDANFTNPVFRQGRSFSVT